MKLFASQPSNTKSDAIHEEIEDESGRKCISISFPGSERDAEIIRVHSCLEAFHACLKEAVAEYKLTRSNKTPIFMELKEKFLALPENSRQKILNFIIGKEYYEKLFQLLIPGSPDETPFVSSGVKI